MKHLSLFLHGTDGKVILKKHDRTGQPLGKNAFIDELEFLLGRQLKRQKPGPKKRDK
jgi:putative transposase